MKNVISIVLAAGNSSRMNSRKSKVLHEVGHRPLILHVLSLTQKAVVVVKKDSDEIQNVVERAFLDVEFAVQEQPLGTGNAVKVGMDLLIDKNITSEYVLILYGDTPLLTDLTIQKLIESKSDCTLLGMEPQNSAPYGRMLTDMHGGVLSIVESLDATPDQKKISLCFGGCMLVKYDLLKKFLSKIDKNNHKKEYYLTSLIEILNAYGYHVNYIVVDEEELVGVNTREELSFVESVFQNRMREKCLQLGVTLQDPPSVFFAYDTQIEKDVLIEPNVYFGPGVSIKSGAWIRAFSYVEGAVIEKDCIVGPFARIRPSTVMEEKSRVGNFVEVKNCALKKGAKVNHLSYVGDATIGEKTNIGAGTVTCNYDGFSKHHTFIGDGVFIGSNSSLVAPVSIEDGAIVGAGSVITKTVSKNALAIGRSLQKEILQGANNYRNKRK